MVSEILPGKWAFSYVIKAEEDPGLEFNYKQVIFNEDGTCALTYDEEISYKDDEGKWHTEIVEKALHGTYVANSSVIRIVSDEFDGKERVLLWAIDSLSTKQIVVEYNFSMMVTCWLSSHWIGYNVRGLLLLYLCTLEGALIINDIVG